MDTVKVLKNLYTSGNLILSNKNLERLQIYLNEKKVLKAAGIQINRKITDLKDEKYEKNRIIRNNRMMKNALKKNRVFDYINDLSDSNRNLMMPAYSNRI